MVDLPYLACEPRRFIVSIAGGGFAGLFAAEFLRRLEADVGQPLSLCFDLYAGTSIGGIIALGLADGQSAKSLAIRLRRLGPFIFPSRTWRRGFGLLAPKHGRIFLKRGLEHLFAARTLGEITPSIIIPTVNLNNAETVLLRSGQGIHKNMPLVDAALATAAAPIYLPIHVYDEIAYTDGGVVANSPEGIAAIEAVHTLGWSTQRTTILVVGSTIDGIKVPGAMNKAPWGAIRWLTRLRIVRLTMSAQVSLARQIALTALGEDSVIAVDRVLSVEQRKFIALDKANEGAIETLCSLASEAYTAFAEKNPTYIANLKAHGKILRQRRVLSR